MIFQKIMVRDVVEFLELDEDSVPELSPEELVERFKEILKSAVNLVHQFPDVSLDNELPNRPRSWKVLLHHVFQIPKAFLDHEETNQEYTYEMMTAVPPDNLKTSEDIANFGEETSKRFRIWWEESSVPLCDTMLLLIRTSNRETPANLVQKLKLIKTDSESGSFAKNSSI